MLSLKNVSIFNKQINVLDNISIEVRQGDFICLVGDDQNAKTALLKTLGLLVSPSKGEILVEGIGTSNFTSKQLIKMRSERFSYILRECELEESLNVEQNIALPLLYQGKSAQEIQVMTERALSIVGMSKFGTVELCQLNEWQRNKVEVARAIASNPKILIADEPCRVPNKEKLLEVAQLLSSLNRDGVTIVIASNIEEFVSKAKRIVRIEGNSLVEQRVERRKKSEESPKAVRKKKKTITGKKSKTIKEERVTDQELVEIAKQQQKAPVIIDDVKPAISKSTRSRKNLPEKQDQKIGNEQLSFDILDGEKGVGDSTSKKITSANAIKSKKAKDDGLKENK